MRKIKNVLKAIGQFFGYLLWPHWGHEHREKQAAYERMLEEGMKKQDK